MASPWWIDAPREQFAAHCMRHFGVTFDAAIYIVRSDHIPTHAAETAPPTAPRPVTSQMRAARRGGRAQIACARLKQGRNFLESR